MNKKIVLKQLVIRNFKGIRHLKIDFNEAETTISGENGTGKTTVLDAFLWLLFGKDSTGRSDSNFNIKTLDENGSPIYKLEHEVSGILLVNNKEVTLQRIYQEKWEKPRGLETETLKSHFTKYSVNGVNLATKKEYEAEVSSIIPEEVFRMITNPFYFPTRPAIDQKTMLLDLAGEVSDDEVASRKPEYRELLNQLSGKSLETFKKEIASKKRAIKEVLTMIPARLDTVNQLMPEPENWEALNKELASKKAKVAEIESQIVDKSKLVESEYQKKAEIQKAIGNKRLQRNQIENNIRSQVSDANNTAREAINSINHKIQNFDYDIQRKRSQVISIDNQIKSIDAELEVLRGQYRSISAELLHYPEGAFECPTCKRALEADDIESKQAELQANFNQNKSQRLQTNKSTGISKAKQKSDLQKQKETILAEISKLEQDKLTLKGQKQYQEENLPAAQNADNLIRENTEWIRLGNEIQDMENQLNVESKSIDVSELQEGKQMLNESISELSNKLAKRTIIEKNQKMINELEESRTVNNQALADLERMEFISLEFQKAKDNELMKRINGLFSIVSFSFVDEQLNGGEKITCVCTVDGVPFPDLNNAMKINAGIDIINAICRGKGVTAPIFIDNRESVNNLNPTLSQVINLVVSTHSELTIN